ncbi:MAG: triose-phosphate isomerase [Burkholderiales bacterium]|nr:triose-phosphate isomerase [Burkholderiales bacterium]
MTSSRRKLVAGNWKMNGTFAANGELVAALLAQLPRDGASVLVCPPAPYLQQVAGLLTGSRIALGAQNVSEFDSGAYTGEWSAPMLREIGCSHAIVGHSERRTLFGETSERVAAKTEAALKAGLIPVVCVGETWPERSAGATEAVVAGQLGPLMGRVNMAGIVIAYEPVWAIGTGKTATPAEAQAVHDFIRRKVGAVDAAAAAGLTILYGGSVNAGNAAALFSCPDIDGALVGGASLKAQDFAAIVRAAAT